MEAETRHVLLYALKSVVGCLAVYGLEQLLHFHDYTWCLISVLLVLSPKGSESVGLALTRIKANLTGGGVSIALLLLANRVELWVFLLAVVLTVLACHLLRIMAGSRSALAAVVIIMYHGLAPGDSFWTLTLDRILSVVTGCAIGLLVTLAFHWKSGLRQWRKAEILEERSARAKSGARNRAESGE